MNDTALSGVSAQPWPAVSIDDIKSQAKSAIAIGPFGSRMKSDVYVEEGIPVIRGMNISSGRSFEGDFVYVSEATADELKSSNVSPDDLVFPHRGAIGEVGIVPRTGPDRWMLSTSLMKLTVDPRLANPLFIYYFFRSPAGRHELLKRSSSVGTPGIAQPLTSLRSISVLLPPLEIQNSIAQLLGAIDDLIDTNRRRVDLLEEMARAMYREWFVDFRFPGHEDLTFVDSALGAIPDGWTIETLGQLVVRRKSTVSPEEADPTTALVGLEHIPRRRLTLDAWAIAEGVGSRKTLFERGDLLFSKIRPYFHKVAVAPIDGICSTDALVFSPVEVHRGQAVMALSSDELIAHATQTANGTKMPRANWDVLAALPAVVPPEPLAVRFTSLVDDVLSTCERLMFASRALTEMRDLLLPKLVTGQIDVSGLDLDAVVEKAAV